MLGQAEQAQEEVHRVVEQAAHQEQRARLRRLAGRVSSAPSTWHPSSCAHRVDHGQAGQALRADDLVTLCRQPPA